MLTSSRYPPVRCAQVYSLPDEAEAGSRDRPASVPSSTGIPESITSLTLIAQFNDLAGVARLLDEHQGQVAGMVVEPIMMNACIIPPVRPGLAVRGPLHDRDQLA